MSLVSLKKALKDQKLVYGAKQTIKNIKRGSVKEVFLASNTSQNIKNDLKYYSKIANIKVSELKQNSEELAIICKKNFLVSVVSY
ncbi:MAG: ribosomal L7Ae/L30e/S12e/Gadd45 family protein [Candidatus Woesearchaeota archaeon]